MHSDNINHESTRNKRKLTCQFPLIMAVPLILSRTGVLAVETHKNNNMGISINFNINDEIFTIKDFKIVIGFIKETDVKIDKFGNTTIRHWIEESNGKFFFMDDKFCFKTEDDLINYILS